MSIRKPAVAGKFYPAESDEIIKLLNLIQNSENKHINSRLSENKIIGGIVPHAAYMYSGYQAIHFFEILKQSLQKFDTFIIVNPNHTGFGAEISTDINTFWETPFGTVEIDSELSGLLKFSSSKEAHQYEHSGEIMVPFLQHFLSYKFYILPITMSVQNYETAQLIASRIYFAAKKIKRKICLIASTDFSHFIEPQYGKIQDEKVINNILKFECEELFKTVKNNHISMCGYGPVAVLCEYSKYVSDNYKIKLLRYGNSGEVSKSDKVVNYASFLVYE
jgi:AmmeMemoRadiSam system protein B